MTVPFRHPLQPLVLPAEIAHTEGSVRYSADGVATFRHPHLLEAVGKEEVSVGPERQFPAIMASFADLSKALSSHSNSPRLEGGSTLREDFDAEFERYRALCQEIDGTDKWEPDYGNYVYDHLGDRLFLILPERWHRTALTTSTGTLLQDPTATMNWSQVRSKLAGARVGVVGVSVGSNVVEGLARELRPKQMKVADPDWVELNNLNRLERVNLSHIVCPRSSRRDAKNALEMQRYSKASVVAYTQQLVDPYAEYFVYPEGLDESNMDAFLLGGDGEPPLDFVVEEADDLEIKLLVRRRCREHGIPVLMMSDFGHNAIVHFQDFRRNPQLSLAYDCSDDKCQALLDRAMTSGNRDDFFAFVHAFMGPDCIRDEFRSWVEGKGERPTSSLPQSGATAMISGGLAGKLAALYLLGHEIPARSIYDFARHTVDA